MFKVIFPLILILALELIPVVKTYAHMKTRYGENLANLTPAIQTDEHSLNNASLEKFSELEKTAEGTRETMPDYWF